MHSIKVKLFLAGLVISIMPILTYQYISFIQSSKTLEQTYSKELKQKTDLITLLINKSISHSISDLKMLSNTISDAVDKQDDAQIKKQFVGFNKIHFDVDSVSLLDELSSIFYSTSDKQKKLSSIAKNMLKEYIQTDMSDVFIYELLDDEPKMYILSKIPLQSKRFILLELNFQNTILLLSNFQDEILGDKSIFLLSKENQIIYETNKSGCPKDFFKHLALFDDNTKIYKYVDCDGENVLSAYDTVFEFGQNGRLGWKVVTLISLNLIDEKVYQTLELNINVGTIISILIVIVLILIAKNISNSIDKVLTLAKKLSEGDYSARVDTKNKIAEFEELTIILNDMSNTIESRNKELEQKNELFKNLAHYDALTSIPNRVLFQDRLEHALKIARRKKVLVALLFIDLDQFKHINDSFGHDYGDEVLVETAMRLKSIVRDGDTIARLGGDEFTVILENINSSSIIDNIAQKIIDIVQEPIVVKGSSFVVSCSIGVSIFPKDADEKSSLVKYADTAMYKAKALGRNRYQFYSTELTQISMERINLEKDIHTALKNEEFIVYYQPQFDIKHNTITGFEALIRWDKSGEGVIPPIKFLPFAEETGLIVLVDKFVMKSAMKQIVYLYNKGYKAGRIALNLSVKVLEEDHFIQNIKEMLLETYCKPEWIELEVTEGHIMNNKENSVKKLQLLHDYGIKIAIDDFGTGYSSLSYLKHLPIDKLKIDKTFVNELPYDKDDVQITKAILSLANSLGLSTIAEGVETIEQKDFLMQNGCINIQGYLYSKPLSAEDMEAMLSHKINIQ